MAALDCPPSFANSFAIDPLVERTDDRTDDRSSYATHSCATQSAPLALVRVFVWETAVHAPALTRYFHKAGHPFVARRPDELPPDVRDRCLRGRTFELFTLPMDLGAVVESLQTTGAERSLEIVLDLSDLPSVLIVRKRPPADPLRPEDELRFVLDLLPTWRPDCDSPALVPASASVSACESVAAAAPAALPMASSPLRRPSRPTSTLKAPFSSVDVFDDDILSFERSTTTVG